MSNESLIGQLQKYLDGALARLKLETTDMNRNIVAAQIDVWERAVYSI
jgi:hypothetical protein